MKSYEVIRNAVDEPGVKAVAAALKVNYIVEGSVTRAGNRIRVRAQLIEATADHHR